MEKYTLVQHSGGAWGQKPGFAHGVEEHRITDRQAAEVLRRGGVVLDGYREASDAAEAENYPAGYEGLYPAAPGEFTNFAIDQLRLYLPARRLAPRKQEEA